MKIGKRLLFSVGWLVVFVGLGNLLTAAHLTYVSPTEPDASNLAGTAIMSLILAIVGGAPFIMAILTLFGRPKWLYGDDRKKNQRQGYEADVDEGN
jgi:hypothetical protein